MQSLQGKNILITGGAGSLGQALQSELCNYDIKSLRIVDNSEYSIVKCRRGNKDKRVRHILADIRDWQRIDELMNGINIAIHTAAIKHVDICEDNPNEVINTNITGGCNVANTAIKNNVGKVLAISSDKAVHPINLYGASKLVMEKYFLNRERGHNTLFSCIRFGNFEGSIGSVLPLWYKQMEKGKTITVTNKEMTRFWIGLDKAAKFVVECVDMIKGGEIFIPKMPRAELSELIQAVAPDAKIKVIGKRRGEKLHELLFNEGESPIDCGDYYLIK